MGLVPVLSRSLGGKVLGSVSAAGGTLYDFTDTTTLRIGRAGQAAFGQPGNLDVVGLIFDKAGGPLGPELLSNGTFDSDVSGWTATSSSGMTPPTLTWVSDGAGGGRMRMTSSADGVFQRAVQTVSGLTAGEWYRLSMTVVAKSGSFSVSANGDGIAGDALDNTDIGYVESYFQSNGAPQKVYPIFPSNPGAGEWTEVDDISVRHAPGRHAVAGSDSTRPTWTNQLLPGVPLLVSNGVDDYCVTNIPAASAGFYMGRGGMGASSSASAPIFCNVAGNTMNLRRSASTNAYSNASAADYGYSDGGFVINGASTTSFTYDLPHTVEVGLGSSATQAAVTRLFGNESLSRYIYGGAQAMIFLPSAPSAAERALYRAWMGSL